MSDTDTQDTPTGVAAPDSPLADPPAVEPVKEDTQPDETANLKRRLAEEERARKRLEAAQKKAEEDKPAEQGEWQKLAEQREAELKAATERSEAIQREQLIARVASRMKFVDPADVISRVPTEDGTDEGTVQAALERIAAASPHLVAKETPVVPEIGQVLAPSATGMPGAPTQADGKPNPPAGKQPLQSLDQWEALPQAERGERMAEADWLFIREK